MPKRIEIAPHLSVEELESRYRQTKDGVERSHYQIIWLLAQGKRSEEVAELTGYSMLAIRQATKGTQFATAQVERLRSMLIKGASRVKVSARRVLVELADYCPFANELRQITQQLRLPNALSLS